LISVVGVEKSCSCSDIKVEPKQLRKGEKAKVSLRWNTSGLRYQQSSDFSVHYKVGDKDDVWFCPIDFDQKHFTIPAFSIYKFAARDMSNFSGFILQFLVFNDKG
jgi:hypothetical protein